MQKKPLEILIIGIFAYTIFNEYCDNVIGNGVVIDPWALLEEIEEIKSKGIEVNVNNFIISESAKLAEQP